MARTSSCNNPKCKVVRNFVGICAILCRILAKSVKTDIMERE